MDIINHYEIITYKAGDKDKYEDYKLDYDCTIYYMNGVRHRDNDLPAIICPNIGQGWYINGKLHRDNDQPAVITADGGKEWWVNGRFIRQN